MLQGITLDHKNSDEFNKMNDRRWNLEAMGNNSKNQTLEFYTAKGYTKNCIRETKEVEIINSKTRKRYTGTID